MTGKADDAFRTISEVSKMLDIPAHVLRFWETKFSDLRPLKRSGGRRYYRPDDIAVLTRIRDLLYKDGFTIKGARRHLKSKEAFASTGVVPGVATTCDKTELVAIQVILETVQERLITMKSRLQPGGAR